MALFKNISLYFVYIFPALVLSLSKDIFERSKKTLQQVQGERSES
jgi:hypothetical protein